MEHVLALLARFFVELLGELILGSLFYWVGWPWVKLFTLGRYPRHAWLSGRREEACVQGVGLVVVVLALLVALGQFGS